MDRSKGYKQMVTGVRSKYFHFQKSQHSVRPLMAAYHITVGETGAWCRLWHLLRRGAVGPSQGAFGRVSLPSVGHEHRCALLAETHAWEGSDIQRLGSAFGHRLQPEMVPDKCWKHSSSLPFLPCPPKDVLKDDTPYLCM